MKTKTNDKQALLNLLNDKIHNCRKCEGLNIPKKTMSAPGNGSPDAYYFAVGQSLHSYNKDTNPQIPFVGPIKSHDSGRLLYKAFEESGIFSQYYHSLLNNLFITNVVHCHVLNNRPSPPSVIENCRQFLQNELSIVKPKVIITLGNDARKWFSLPVLSGSSRCYVWTYRDMELMNGIPFVVSVHPSYIMRYGSDKESTRYIKEMKESVLTAKKWSEE